MRKSGAGLPTCEHPKRDCCNLERYGGCVALNMTIFRDKTCPFYLAADKVKKEDWQYHKEKLPMA